MVGMIVYFCGLLWLLSFVFSFTFLPSLQTEMVGASVVTLMVTCLICTYRGLNAGVWQIPKSYALLALLLFWALSAASVLWSHIQWVSYMQFWVFSFLPLSVLALIRLDGGTQDRVARLLVPAVVVIITGCAGFALVQYYVLTDMLFYGRVQWPLRNPNSLGAVFSFGCFMALMLLFDASSRRLKTIYCLAFLLLFSGLITTGSRGALWAFILLGGVCVFMLRTQMSAIVSKRAIVMIFALMVLIMVAVSLTGVRPDNVALFTSITGVSGQTPLLWSRGLIWSGTLDMIRAHPFLGTGVGTFPSFYGEYHVPQDVSGGYTAHNDALQFWAERGVLGILLFYAFAVSLVIRTFRALRVCTVTHSYMRIVLMACAICAMGLHAHVSANLHILPILFLTALAFVVWLKACDLPLFFLRLPKSMLFPGLRGVGLLIMIAVLWLMVVVPPFISNHYVKKADRFHSYQNIERYVDFLNAAQRWSMGLSAQPYVMAAPLQISMLAQDYNILMRADRAARVAEIKRNLGMAEALNPRLAGIYYNRALLAQLILDDAPEYNDIDRALEAGLGFKPRHNSTRIWLARRLMARDDVEGAYEIMKDGMRWCNASPQKPQCHNLMAQILTRTGRSEELQLLLKNMNKSVGRP